MKTNLPHLLLVLLLAALPWTIGCGGGAGGKDDDDGGNGQPVSYDLGGRILARDGAAVGDATVTARVGDGSDTVLDTATSAADGSYSVRVPEKTPFYLHVEKAAYAPTNSQIRELTGTSIGVDVVLFLQTQADSLLGVLGGPVGLTRAHFLFLIQALDPLGAELTGVSVTVTPVGLLVQYRQADGLAYTSTGPTLACTAGGGCLIPHIAGYAQSINQGISIFRLSSAGGGTLALAAAPLAPGEVTYIAND